MSKLYKGWEIAKMVSEGILKDGDKIKSPLGSEYTIYMGGIFSTFGQYVELGASMFASNSAFYEIVEKIQKPVSFMEAINSGKRIKCIHSRFVSSNLYMTILQMFKSLSASALEDFIPDLINNGKWYIEEK